MNVTKVFKKNFEYFREPKNRLIINQGGTSSSKTYSILQLLILLAIKNKNKGCLISVVAESFPHLRRGAMRDFFKILQSENLYNRNNHDKTNNTYHIGKSQIEFFSADNDAKLRGARRDYLFVNECNNITINCFNELEPRTNKQIFLDYNPVSNFWVHEYIFSGLYKHKFKYIQSTYKDNDQLSKQIIKSIESRKNDENWWRVYGKGETGMLDGLVFNFETINEIPKEAVLKSQGLDFGYTNDPSSFIEMYYHNGNYIFNERLYRTGLTNNDIVNFFKSNDINRNVSIFADSSEPKSIEEIYRAGYNVKPIKKGKDSIIYGIDKLKESKIIITSNSVNLIKELRNYTWEKDKEGKALNQPIDYLNHAIDAMRYARTGIEQQQINRGAKSVWKTTENEFIV